MQSIGDARLGNELDDTYYLLGSALGPHPVSTHGAQFQSNSVRREASEQILSATGKMAARAGSTCVGGGNAMVVASSCRRRGPINGRRSGRIEREAS